MKWMRFCLLLFFLIAAWAQQPQPVPPVKLAGVQTPWDVRAMINKLIEDNENFAPVLDTIHPQDWVAKGASPVYVQQLQQAQQQTHDVVYTSKLLAQKTDQLSLALDEYFRLEALDSTVRSLGEGLRRYADRASADKLDALIAHNFSAREQFRDYLSSLVTTGEQNFKVADQEAQRCRGIISREPAPQKTKK
jgi:hypothetical protein